MRIEGTAGFESLVPKNQETKKASGFAEYLKEAMNELNKLQEEATLKATDLLKGDLDNIHQAVIAYEKAYLALQLTAEVRNRMIEAYHEIMRMQM